MPRRDEFEDEDDAGYLPPPPKLRQGSNPTVIILVVLGVVVLVGLAVCAGLFAWTGTRVVAPPPATNQPASRPAAADEAMTRVYTRDEFRRLVMGKTEQEVIDELGKPNIASETPDVKLWIYRNRTMTRANGHTDPQVTIRLEGGRVVAIEF